MASMTSRSPVKYTPAPAYTVAGTTQTILGVTSGHDIRIPFECSGCNGGLGASEVMPFRIKSQMIIAHAAKRNEHLRKLRQITLAEIASAEANDLPRRYRVAHQSLIRNEDVIVRHPSTPGGAS
ncbi:MAG: ferredoxin [Pseudomonadota bacterium]